MMADEGIALLDVQVKKDIRKDSDFDDSMGREQVISTQHGDVHISISGDLNKPVILTYPDLGLNHISNYHNFVNFYEVNQLLSKFCVVHLNAIGQEPNAETLPDNFIYPTMSELSDTVFTVVKQLGISAIIGFGVGLGANVLSQFAIRYPQLTEALVLINGTSTEAGWIEWGYQKLNLRHLKAGSMTTGTVDYLLWHHFGKVDECNYDLVNKYRKHFEQDLNATNLGFLIDSYIRRTDLGISRELNPNKKDETCMIRCAVLNITCNFSPHVDDTVNLNGRLDPTNSTWMKIQDCGLVLDEQPGKVAQALRLFLQGQGYTVDKAPKIR